MQFVQAKQKALSLSAAAGLASLSGMRKERRKRRQRRQLKGFWTPGRTIPILSQLADPQQESLARLRPMQRFWISEPDTQPNQVGTFGSAGYKDTIPLRENGKFCISEQDTEPNCVGSFGSAQYTIYVAILKRAREAFQSNIASSSFPWREAKQCYIGVLEIPSHFHLLLLRIRRKNPIPHAEEDPRYPDPEIQDAIQLQSEFRGRMDSSASYKHSRARDKEGWMTIGAGNGQWSLCSMPVIRNVALMNSPQKEAV